MVDPGLGRVPPHDLDAEAAVLSAVLLTPDGFDRVQESLRAEYFYSDAHRKVFEAVYDIRGVRGGSAIDAVVVAGVAAGAWRAP